MYLNSFLTQGLDCMYSTVVELDTLTDTDCTGTEDEHFFVWCVLQLALLLPGGVIVWCLCRELCCTGIDHLVGRKAHELFNLVNVPAGQLPDLCVGESELLCGLDQFFRRVFAEFKFNVNHVLNLLQEERFNLGQLVDILHCHTKAECIEQRREPFIRRAGEDHFYFI